ncbi:MAG: hypothetical protein ACI9YT_001387 [Halobacteriales archaeon]|jgi:hypothetical protein
MTGNTDVGRVDLPSEWAEVAFDRGTYGGNDREGFEVAFETEGEGPTVRVLPVRYERNGLDETIEALTADVRQTRRRIGIDGLDRVPSLTAFGVHVTYRPVTTERELFYTIAADPGDALAIACWIASRAATDDECHDLVRTHAGTYSSLEGDDVLSDEEVLGARLADAPTRCLFRGKQTRSHRLDLPLRCAPLLDGYPTSRRGMPRVPATVETGLVAISHDAWEEHELDAAVFDVPTERIDEGAYRLCDPSATAIDAGDASRLAIRGLGEDEPIV